MFTGHITQSQAVFYYIIKICYCDIIMNNDATHKTLTDCAATMTV